MLWRHTRLLICVARVQIPLIPLDKANPINYNRYMPFKCKDKNKAYQRKWANKRANDLWYRCLKALREVRYKAKLFSHAPCNVDPLVLYLSYTGSCYCCSRPQNDFDKRLCLDHDHTTGSFRGWLCLNCNTAIGQMQNNPELLRKAAEYLLQ